MVRRLSLALLLTVLAAAPIMAAPPATGAVARAAFAGCPTADDEAAAPPAEAPLRAADHGVTFGDPAFQRLWRRSDGPVAANLAARSWLWGPEPWRYAMNEEYLESPGGSRLVQYFDKSRMEITDRRRSPDDPAYVSNGLLVVELVTGCLQLGDRFFLPRPPSTAQVVGDQLPASRSPTYAALAAVRDAPARPTGTEITAYLGPDGAVSDGGPGGVTAARYVAETGHTVSSVFWDYLQAEGLVDTGAGYATARLIEPTFYATGYPITEAYWTIALVRGRPARALLQCFERRCLTYTPGNPAGFEVEAGNVGQHYYQWRHGA
jgi:hypothetical protein